MYLIPLQKCWMLLLERSVLNVNVDHVGNPRGTRPGQGHNNSTFRILKEWKSQRTTWFIIKKNGRHGRGKLTGNVSSWVGRGKLTVVSSRVVSALIATAPFSLSPYNTFKYSNNNYTALSSHRNSHKNTPTWQHPQIFNKLHRTLGSHRNSHTNTPTWQHHQILNSNYTGYSALIATHR